jgi:hypothetical protein
MKKLLLAVAILSPAILLAQNPFDGTWKTRPDQSTFSPKRLRLAVSKGFHDALSTVSKVQVKADGQHQPVSGHPYDTVAVKEVDEHTV